MKIEQAFNEDGEFVGWRLTAHESTVLVYHEPRGIDGFRVGQGFNPTYNGSITYRDVTPAIDASSDLS